MGSIPRRLAVPLQRAMEHQDRNFHSDLVDAVDAIFLLETVAGGTGRIRRHATQQLARTPQEQATWARLENDTLSLAASLRDTRPVAAKSDLIHAFPPQFSASSSRHMQDTTALVEAAAPELARRFAEAERHFASIEEREERAQRRDDEEQSGRAGERGNSADEEVDDPLQALSAGELSDMLRGLVSGNESLSQQIDALKRESEALAAAQTARQRARDSDGLGWAAQPQLEVMIANHSESSVAFWRQLLSDLESDLEADERSRAASVAALVAGHSSGSGTPDPSVKTLVNQHLDTLFSERFSEEAFVNLTSFADYAHLLLASGFR